MPLSQSHPGLVHELEKVVAVLWAALVRPVRASVRWRMVESVVAVASAPVEGGTPGTARVVRAADQRVATAGTGNWQRTIRTILRPGDDAGRLIVGETVNPPGNWSSYPPHKHDRQAPPEEVALEEVYFYRLRPEGGFAIQLLYDGDEERAVCPGINPFLRVRVTDLKIEAGVSARGANGELQCEFRLSPFALGASSCSSGLAFGVAAYVAHRERACLPCVTTRNRCGSAAPRRCAATQLLGS